MAKELKRLKDFKFSKEVLERAGRICDKIRQGKKPNYDKEIHPEMLISLFSEGKDIEAFCYAVEIHRDTFHEWTGNHKEFKEAYKHAKECALLYYIELGQKHIPMSSIEFNTTLWSMMMRNRFRFTEHRPVQVPGLDKAKTIMDKAQCIAKAIKKGNLAGSEINYMTNFLVTCLRVDEYEHITKRLDALEAQKDV